MTISSEVLKNEQVTLYDLNGNIVTQSRIEEGKARLGVSSLASGIYFIKCGAFIKKVLIEGKP